jgi:hypothetical protein
MGRGGKGRERRGGMGKGLGGSTASWLLGGMDAIVVWYVIAVHNCLQSSSN